MSKYKNFKANIIEENDRMFVLEWKNKDGSIFYSSTFYLDKVSGTLMIVSDMGTCIARWYNEVSETNLCTLLKDIYYFASKITCIDCLYIKTDEAVIEDIEKAKEIYISKYGSDDRTESDFEYIKNALLYSKIDDYPELTELYTMYKLNEIIDGEPGERLNPAVKAFSDGYIRAMKQLGRWKISL